ncbi:MAG: hypothetical protein GX902_03000 [Lentisphaerae bacterium]|nr:hypothetical protein [Lentisphaerota bacterium]
MQNRPQDSKAFRRLCRTAAQACHKFQMLAPGDRLLVGISGGEDSLLLMHILAQLQRRAPFPFELIPANIDMAFATFAVERLQEYCCSQGWELRVLRLSGSDILDRKGAGDKPCPLCSRLRRGQLHQLADELNCNKIVLGQHLDDLCVSFLMALFRGGGLKTMGPNVAADSGSKRLIRPLCLIRKAEIQETAELFNFPAIKSCPYEAQLQEHGDRYYLEQLLEQLNCKFKDVRSAMLHSMGDIRTGHLLDLRFLNTESDPDQGKF